MRPLASGVGETSESQKYIWYQFKKISGRFIMKYEKIPLEF